MFDWKYVELPCPHCGFTHKFKRESWRYDRVPILLTGRDVWLYLGSYISDDVKSRKSCKQELQFGEEIPEK